jgi:MoxR-like ATPase
MNELEIPQCWRDVQDVLAAGVDRLMLYGPPGVGKTQAGLRYGDVARGAWRVPCTEDMTEAHLTGHMMPNGEEWAWNDGPIAKALRVQGRVVLDEVDRLNGDVLSLALALTDSADSVVWDHPLTGERLTAGSGYTVVATTNSEDPVADMDPALLDRFTVRIRINAPHPDALYGLSPDLRRYAMRAADLGDRRISLRSFQTFDKLRKGMGDETRAASVVFGKNAQAVLDAIAIDRVAV